MKRVLLAWSLGLSSTVGLAQPPDPPATDPPAGPTAEAAESAESDAEPAAEAAAAAAAEAEAAAAAEAEAEAAAAAEAEAAAAEAEAEAEAEIVAQRPTLTVQPVVTTRSSPEAPEAEEPVDEEHERTGGAAALGTLFTADRPLHAQFSIWRDGDDFIKPVLQISALLVGYLPHSDVSMDLANRVSTLALARFGFEGELFGFVSFRSVFERNLGYSLARNGPVGTSVWEGTASLSARENYVRLHKWGLALTGGIFRDPATVDYISENVLDAFGMDPYVRDPLLVSGFSQGQGFMLRYNWRWLTGGVSFTAGNPLTSSLAFGFAGDVTSLGTLFSAPLRALSNGVPGSDIQMYVTTPSLAVEHELFQVKLAAQIYRVDADVTSGDDQRLNGYNLRATARARVWEDHAWVFGGFAYRRNGQLAVPDLTMTKADYEGVLANGGFDLRFGAFGAGASYYWIRASTSPTSDFTNHYINVGLTYWLHEPNVSVGVRWARSMADIDTDPPSEPRLKSTDSLTLSVRLLL